MLPRPSAIERGLSKTLAALRRRGVLLKTDPERPCVTALVAGAPVRGSWWGHPKSHAIFAVLERLAEHPEVLLCKLVAGKDTFVHRKLWPALRTELAATRTARLRDLSPAARRLLARVEQAGPVRLDRLARSGSAEAVGLLAAGRELEARLLVRSEEFHTESGAHARRLESWSEWAKRLGVRRGRGQGARAEALAKACSSATAAATSGKGMAAGSSKGMESSRRATTMRSPRSKASRRS